MGYKYRVKIDYRNNFDFIYWENAASFIEVVLGTSTKDAPEVEVKLVKTSALDDGETNE